MGIQDRDYMRRPSGGDDGGRRGGRRDERSSDDYGDEGILGRFFRRNPRFLTYVCIGLGVLILIAVLAVKFSERHR